MYSVSDNPDIEGSTKEATDLDKSKVDRLGPGDWSSYVEFDEFDGGDGQMGVAGDGKKVRTDSNREQYCDSAFTYIYIID